MEFKDYYRIMGVARDASQDEIKRVYRRLARKYHPDVSKSPDAERRFKELGEANAVLKDLKKRAAYDLLGTNWKAGEEFHPPPASNTGFEFSRLGSGAQYVGYFSAFFESLFGYGFDSGWRSHATVHARGEDYHGEVMIDLEDAYSGATRTIALQTSSIFDTHGRRAADVHSLNVSISVGIRAGKHIRLLGQGAPGIGEGKPGGLYLEVEFHPHKLYRVEQSDVYLDLPVAPWEAVLGTKVKVPAPNGMVELKIPTGSGAGTTLRLKGRGIPGIKPGDFYVVLQISLPPTENDAIQAVYRNMAVQFKSFNPRARLGV